MQDQRNSQSDKYRYGFNGKEKDNEIKGNVGNSYDFGARMYDPRVGKFLSIDRFTSKFSFQSPYVFANNTPIMGTDINGDSLYVLIYSRNNATSADDAMFKAAAQTRKNDIENSKGFDPKTDKVQLLYIEDISNMKYKMDWVVEKYSGTYGKTKEVSIYTHSGTNGPVGTDPAVHYNLMKETNDHLDNLQMTLDGWKDIDFNWGSSGCVARFYGCNSSYKGGNDVNQNFILAISMLANFKNVEVWGQIGSSKPSLATDDILCTDEMSSGNFSQEKGIYMVTGVADFSNAMARAKNGNVLSQKIQPGKTANLEMYNKVDEEAWLDDPSLSEY